MKTLTIAINLLLVCNAIRTFFRYWALTLRASENMRHHNLWCPVFFRPWIMTDNQALIFSRRWQDPRVKLGWRLLQMSGGRIIACGAFAWIECPTQKPFYLTGDLNTGNWSYNKHVLTKPDFDNDTHLCCLMVQWYATEMEETKIS